MTGFTLRNPRNGGFVTFETGKTERNPQRNGDGSITPNEVQAEGKKSSGQFLAGGFKYFLCSSLFGEDSQFE